MKTLQITKRRKKIVGGLIQLCVACEKWEKHVLFGCLYGVSLVKNTMLSISPDHFSQNAIYIQKATKTNKPALRILL